jgi:conjugative transposon TraN protein
MSPSSKQPISNSKPFTYFQNTPSMKQLLFFPLVMALVLNVFQASAQDQSIPLPSSTIVPHYILSISFNTTTVLIFSAPVKPVDRGDRDILAQKQPGVENVLKLKAARKNFPETNLHVFTADGKVYAFDILYTDSLASTRNLIRLFDTTKDEALAPVAVLTGQPVNSEQLVHYVEELKSLPRTHHGPAGHADRMTLRLDRVGIAGPLLVFRLQIANHSNLDYHLDFIRLYVRDRQKAKRTSVQEREILPVYEDAVSTIPGDSTLTHVLVLPAFSLADGKQFVLEAYEKNGGRNLTLYIKNKVLFKAKKL